MGGAQGETEGAVFVSLDAGRKGVSIVKMTIGGYLICLVRRHYCAWRPYTLNVPCVHIPMKLHLELMTGECIFTLVDTCQSVDRTCQLAALTEEGSELSRKG